MEKLNCILIADEFIANTFRLYKYLRRLNLSNNIHIERGGINTLAFLQEFANENANTCPELIIINSKMSNFERFQFIDFINDKNYCNRESVRIIILEANTAVSDYTNIIPIKKPITDIDLLEVFKNPNLPVFIS